MATFIPSLSSVQARAATSGELRVARTLDALLEDDYLCWHETPVGAVRPRYTDFIVLHPRRGLLLLEVKDWKLGSIERFDRDGFTLHGGRRLTNPLTQVRRCTYALVDQLRRDSALTRPDGRYAGRLVCPYAFGVVLTNVTRAQFDANGLGEVLTERFVVCGDELARSQDPEAFQKRLWDMFPYAPSEPLSVPLIDRVRWHLFPEIRIAPTAAAGPDDAPVLDPVPDLVAEPAAPSAGDLFPDVVRIMDVQQEQLARSLGEGHRVIHGVAGSGKTLILGYRCLHLAETLAKPILVLCFNIALGARLRELMTLRGVADRVHVRHFHDWCGEQLRAYHVPRPEPGPGYVAALVRAVIDGVAAGQIPKGQYGAIMIDEGHDFEPDWLRLVVDVIDPDDESLLLLYDDAQSIYRKDRRLGFSLSSVGVRARGRTTVLRLNYRNTDEILGFAYRFARQWIEPGIEPGADGDDEVPRIAPESAGRHGPEPAVRSFPDFEAEAGFVARQVAALHARGTPLAEIAVLYRSEWMGRNLSSALDGLGVPVHWLRNPAEKKRLASDDARAKLMTMHSSKGLEFPFVAVTGTGDMPLASADVDAEARLLYVAMTRATERLLVTGVAGSGFAERLAA